jgi:2-polyprenyl-3-methyl-5-hydroxy-6-metoxy-1,4-benzoquinol methylase
MVGRDGLIMTASADAAATFPCRLCDGEDLFLYYAQGNDGRFRYYKCRQCGLVNLDLANGLDQEQYTEQWIDPTDDGRRQHRDIDASFEFLTRYVQGPKRLLDIGCGNGRMLHLARRAGWSVKGIELSPKAAEAVRRTLGVDVVAADFLSVAPTREDLERYDVICLRHVLEHLPDSRLAMQKIRAMLRPDGHVLLEMPNIEGFDKRLKRWINDHGFHRRRFADDFIAGHCNEFCREPFEYLLGLTGFRLIRWETYSKKPLSNFLFNRIHIGNKARALIQRADAVGSRG